MPCDTGPLLVQTHPKCHHHCVTFSRLLSQNIFSASTNYRNLQIHPGSLVPQKLTYVSAVLAEQIHL